MANKEKRSLAGFSDVASPQENNEKKTQKEKTVSSEKNTQQNKNDIIRNVRSKQKKPDKRMVGIYFEEKVAAGLDLLSQEGKGVKSQVVNDLVKEALIEEGLVEDD